MATIVTRAGKGSPLTNQELDNNFSNLNTDKAELSGATFTGAITANAGVKVDNFTLDGTTLALSSGNMLLDVAGYLDLDIDNGGSVYFSDGGQTFGQVYGQSSNFHIKSQIGDKDILFQGVDSSSGAFTALTLDMSAAGAATFNSSVTSTGQINVGTNLVAGTSVYSGNGAYFGSSTLSLKNSSSVSFLDFASNGNATFNSSVGIVASGAPAFSIQDSDGTNQLGTIGHNGGETSFTSRNNTGNGSFKFYTHDGSTFTDRFNIASSGAATFSSSVTATSLDISGNIDVDGITNLDVVDIDGAVDMATTALFSKTAYGAVDSENFYRIKFKDQGGIANDVGIGQPNVDSIGFNFTPTANSGGLFFTGGTVGEVLRLTSNGAAFNENGLAALDFKVESNGNANMLFVDGSDNAVGIGTNTPANYYAKNLVVSAPSDGGLTIASTATSNTNYLLFADGTSGDSAYRGQIAYSHNTDLLQLISSGTMKFKSGSSRTEALAIDASQNATFSGDVSVPNISVADDIRHSGDSDTYISFEANNQTFYAGGTRALDIAAGSVVLNEGGGDVDFKVESGGNANMLFVDGGNNRVGVGTGSATSPFHVLGTSSDTIDETKGTVKFQGSGGNGLIFGTISSSPFSSYIQSGFVNDTSAARYNLSLNPIGGNVIVNEGGVDADFRVESAVNASSLTVEGSSGKVNVGNHFGIGKASGGEQQSSGSGFFFVPGANGYYSHLSTVDTANFSSYFNRKTQTGGFFNFAVNNVGVGSVTYNGSNTVYGTSSDERLKENIADADDAGSKIDAMQVRKFDWKINGNHQEYGMVAQELLPISPISISQGETEKDMMGVDYSTLVPMLIKEIQSLRQRVAQLEE